MSSQIHKALIWLVAILGYGVAEAQTFRVALKSVPTSVHPDMYQDMSANFVLRQLFDVLFQESRGAWSPNKKLLRSWISLDDFKVFELCPQKGVRFTTGAGFNSNSLKQNIELFARKNIFSANLSEIAIGKSDCVVIKFAESYPGFPESLSELNAGVRDPATFEAPIPAGTTDYIVDKVVPGKPIELKTVVKLARKVDFSKVEFEDFDERKLHLYHSIDVAFLAAPPRTDVETSKYFVSSTVPAPIGLYLAAGSASSSIRKMLVGCIDREKVGQSFFGDKNYSTMNTFFPSWFGNSFGILKKEQCKGENQTHKEPIRIVFKQRKTDAEMQKRLFASLSSVQKVFPNLKIESLSDDEYVAATNSKKKPYDFLLVMIASQRISYFLHRMISASDSKTVAELSESKSREFQQRSSRAIEWNDRIKLLEDASVFLLDGAYVTPIAEARATRYFSKKIAYPPASSFDSFTGFYIGDLKEK